MQTAGLSGYKTEQVRTLPSAIPLATCMAAECCQVAKALGVEIEPVMGKTTQKRTRREERERESVHPFYLLPLPPSM
jgi:ketopantoate reductase